MTIEVTHENNWIKTGTVTVKDETGTFKILVNGGASVSIPKVDKSEAIDLFEQMMNGAGSNKEEVYPNYKEDYYE